MKENLLAICIVETQLHLKLLQKKYRDSQMQILRGAGRKATRQSQRAQREHIRVSPATMTGTQRCTPSQEHNQRPHGDIRVLRAIIKGCGWHAKLVFHCWVPWHTNVVTELSIHLMTNGFLGANHSLKASMGESVDLLLCSIQMVGRNHQERCYWVVFVDYYGLDMQIIH